MICAAKLPKLSTEATLCFLRFCRCGPQANKREESGCFRSLPLIAVQKWIAIVENHQTEKRALNHAV
jgi:hypothetical protein